MKRARRKSYENRPRSVGKGSARTDHFRRRTLELIEDLSIHQEELKIQNEELLKVHHELESSRAKYFEMYDLAPVGYITFTSELSSKESNLTASKLLGSRERTSSTNGCHLLFLPVQESLYLHYRRLAKGTEKQVSTFLVRKKDGKELYRSVREQSR